MKKRIILILPTAGGGGSEKVLINLANLLSISFSVTLCFINLKKTNYLHLINKNIKIINLNKNNARRSILNLLKIINFYRFKYVVSSIFHINIISILLKLFSFNKFKLIIRETNKISQKKINFTKLIFIFIFYRFADLIISPSSIINDHLKNFLLKKKKIKLLNNPVIINKDIDKKKYPNRLKVFLNKSKYLITLTRLEKHKNIEFMLNCLVEVNKTKELKLVIVGDGPEKQKLNNKIKELNLQKKVIIIKFLSNPYDFLKRSSLYFNSSYYEGQSNSVLEALFFNIPVISADNGSHTIFIKKYSYGHVFKNFNITKVSKKILELIIKKKPSINTRFYQDVSGVNIVNKFINLINKI